MKIRAALRDDIPSILDMSDLYIYSPFMFDQQLARYSVRKPVFIQKMLEIPGAVLLVSDDHGIVSGYILLTINEAMSDMAGLKIANILLLSVKPESRSRGYAKRLVEKGVDLMRHLGAKIVTVGTDLYNNPALSVYESCGFHLRMGWHIFRLFPNHIRKHEDIEIDTFDESGLEAYGKSFHRAISLFYELSMDSGEITKELFERLKKSLINGSTTAMESENGMLMVFTRDELSEQAFDIERVYRVSDFLFKNENYDEKYAVKFIQTAISRLNTWDYVEIWLDASDQKRIRLFEDAGFRLSYTGVSLHKTML